MDIKNDFRLKYDASLSSSDETETEMKMIYARNKIISQTAPIQGLKRIYQALMRITEAKTRTINVVLI